MMAIFFSDAEEFNDGKFCTRNLKSILLKCKRSVDVILVEY